MNAKPDSSKRTAMFYPYRVFISYAHEDMDVTIKIINILEQHGLKPIWDKDIHPGTPFTDAIKNMIAHSHVFMPIITEYSQMRPWVHQETGYAKALDIPILPIAVGNIPSAMIAQLQAIPVQADLENFIQRLENINFEQLVIPAPRGPESLVEIVDWPEKRAELLARYANWVADSGDFGWVRHQAKFTSFSIPDEDIGSSIWKTWEGTVRQSDYGHYSLREERRAIERHVRVCGASLIIDPRISYYKDDPQALKVRVSILTDFLSSMDPDKLKIVISSLAGRSNLVIVGDYFAAESQNFRVGGYRQTIFNFHPPTVLQRIHLFDQEFEKLYVDQKLSCKDAIDELQKILSSLPTVT